MKTLLSALLSVFALAFCTVPSRADDGPKSGKNLKPVFSDDFQGRTKLGSDYSTARATEDAWIIRDGVLFGKQTFDDHGAVMRKKLDFDDFHVQFDFRFNGGTRFNFVIDDKNEKSVHAGHICRASISPKRIMIGDDKTGVMNLKIRSLRQSKTLSPEQQEALAQTLKRTQASAAVKLQKGRWYQLAIRIQGDVMTATLDGKQIATLKSPGIAHPTKTKFGMTVNGSTIDFDNLKVFATE